MTIDFETHLSSLYPGHHYKVERLTGGLVNLTVRAHRTDLTEVKDGQEAPLSLILKHAPPHIASADDNSPFSQDRQLVEGAALKLFTNSGPLSSLNTPQTAQIPRLINHDPSKHILMQEDLGPLITLWDIFSPQTITTSPITPQALKSHCFNIGHRIGTLFAQAHSGESLSLIQTHLTTHDLKILTTPLTTDVIFEVAVKPILSRLQNPGGFPTFTAESLYARVHKDYHRTPYPGEPCLSMGDFHPGSVLTTPLHEWTDESRPKLGVIDWEFATIKNGRGINGDMVQLLASFHALLLSLARESLTYEAVDIFVRGVCRAYAESSEIASKVRDALGRKDAADPSMGIFRSASILLGRETINQAVDLEAKWEENGSGISVAEMVQAGAWYIQRAGDDVGEMLGDENWAELMREEKGIILTLFGLVV